VKRFLITYDLLRPGQNYEKLFPALQRIGAVRVLYSTWVVRGNWSAKQLCDYVYQVVDANDRILVTEMGDWAAWNAMADINKV
jgi:hypothetical protein